MITKKVWRDKKLLSYIVGSLPLVALYTIKTPVTPRVRQLNISAKSI